MTHDNKMTATTLSEKVVDIKFNVDIALEFDQETGVYSPLNLQAGALSNVHLMDPAVGFKYWEMGMKLQGENIVKAGSVVKMRANDAKKYINAKIQKSGHSDPRVFTCDPNDPRLYKEYPVASMVS